LSSTHIRQTFIKKCSSRVGEDAYIAQSVLVPSDLYTIYERLR